MSRSRDWGMVAVTTNSYLCRRYPAHWPALGLAGLIASLSPAGHSRLHACAWDLLFAFVTDEFAPAVSRGAPTGFGGFIAAGRSPDGEGLNKTNSP